MTVQTTKSKSTHASRVARHPDFPEGNRRRYATEDVINFNVPKENFVASAIPWGQSGADGLGDLAKWQDMIASQGKKKPMFAFLEKATFELLLSQEKQ